MDFNVSKPTKDGVVKITVPASVAFNGKLFESNVRELVKQLGCESCHSGKDYRYVLAKDYLVDDNLAFKPVRSQFFDADPDGSPALNASANLRIGLTTKQGNNLDIVLRVIDKIRKDFGCAPCHSGLDLSFRGEIEKLTGSMF